MYNRIPQRKLHPNVVRILANIGKRLRCTASCKDVVPDPRTLARMQFRTPKIVRFHDILLRK